MKALVMALAQASWARQARHCTVMISFFKKRTAELA